VAAACPRIVIALLVSTPLVAGCGGGDNQASSDSSVSEAATATPTPPASGGGGGGGAPEPMPSTTLQEGAKRFRTAVEKRCQTAGEAVRVSASTAASDARKKQMTAEIEYLEALDAALEPVAKRPPKGAPRTLRKQLDDYRARVRAQIALDKRIAAAEDGYSVRVGMNQNEKNRKARNDIVRLADFDDCLHARRPR
jgi:hypothetical protein